MTTGASALFATIWPIQGLDVYADAEGKNEVTKDSLVISATGAPVDTGDDFSLVPVLVLMVLSAAGMALLVIKRKEF